MMSLNYMCVCGPHHPTRPAAHVGRVTCMLACRTCRSYTSGHDKEGRPIVVLVGSNLPIGLVDMRRVVLYAVKLLDKVAAQDFVVSATVRTPYPAHLHAPTYTTAHTCSLTPLHSLIHTHTHAHTSTHVSTHTH